jgi:hypothetical protein
MARCINSEEREFLGSCGGARNVGLEGGAVSLRTALSALPDDRATASTVREVIAYVSAHRRETLASERISRATGMGEERVEPVLTALCAAGVLHCDGAARPVQVSFDPDHVLELEVTRYLRSAGNPDLRLQAGVGRFRNRLG